MKDKIDKKSEEKDFLSGSEIPRKKSDDNEEDKLNKSKSGFKVNQYNASPKLALTSILLICEILLEKVRRRQSKGEAGIIKPQKMDNSYEDSKQEVSMSEKSMKQPPAPIPIPTKPKSKKFKPKIKQTK